MQLNISSKKLVYVLRSSSHLKMSFLVGYGDKIPTIYVHHRDQLVQQPVVLVAPFSCWRP
ncbi:hypothetical protein F383_26747 [Gossypium arboreum]|uniref:Uncharacterized protein n=3 Tax=Gossypium TaxID=3633 RepID=A0A0B0MMZ3_GOSAR|nr:hypothetical protein ES319_A10G140200v1 [Gossypium barbadense]KHG03493.1 hypothetical protein F383_26747 [Gossypium arboreum]TYG98913.1 hypothetical protein ES288_A10G155100v1 [Gossypium darwinii]